MSTFFPHNHPQPAEIDYAAERRVQHGEALMQCPRIGYTDVNGFFCKGLAEA